MKLIYLICLLVSCSLNKNFNFETKMPKRGLEPLNVEKVKDEADDFDGTIISPTTGKFTEMIQCNDTKKLSRQFSTEEGKKEFNQ